MTAEERHGVLYGAGAYLIWGVIPIYFMAVRFASAPEVLAHRIVWSVILLAGLLFVMGQLRSVTLLPRRLIFGLAASSLLLSSNWLIYVWALFHERMIETSLGYYINPLVTVMLGVTVMAERPSRWQWIALAIAGVGVGYELLVQERIPWVALGLATSFGLYGLLRKQLGVASLPGLAVEVMWLMPAAMAYLAWNYFEDGKLVVSHTSGQWWLLAVGGLVTILPLLAFAAATIRIPLTILGFLQYLSPSIALVIAIAVYDEQLRPGQLLTFSCIWLALLIFSGEGLYDRWRLKRRGKPA